MGVLPVWCSGRAHQCARDQERCSSRNREHGTTGPLSPANVQVPTPVTREFGSPRPLSPANLKFKNVRGFSVARRVFCGFSELFSGSSRLFVAFLSGSTVVLSGSRVAFFLSPEWLSVAQTEMAPNGSVSRKCCSSQVPLEIHDTSFQNITLRDVDILTGFVRPPSCCQVARPCSKVREGKGPDGVGSTHLEITAVAPSGRQGPESLKISSSHLQPQCRTILPSSGDSGRT